MKKSILIISLTVISVVSAFGQQKFQPFNALPSGSSFNHSGDETGGGLGYDLYLGLDFVPCIRMGSVRDSLLTGYAVLAEADVFVKENLSAGLQVGIMHFKTDPVTLGEGKHNFIPVCLKGAYYFFTDEFRPYAGLSLGYYIGKKDYDFKSPPYFDPVLHQTVEGQMMSRSLKTNAFGVAPLAGLQYFLNDQLALHFGCQYDIIFTEKKATSLLGIKIGAVYKLGI